MEKRMAQDTRKLKILYVGTFDTPETSAASMRVYRVGKIFRQLGTTVEFFCISSRKASQSLYTTVIDGFQYYIKPESISRVINYINYYSNYTAILQLRHLIKENGYDAIILYNDMGYITQNLLPYCKKQNIKIGADVTEWYEISTVTGLEKHKAKCVNNRILHKDRNLDFVISISPFLTKYYSDLGVDVIEIPPLMDEFAGAPRKHYVYPSTPTAQINLIYCGAPAKKDQIEPVVGAVADINRNGVRIRLDVVGTTCDNGSQQSENERVGIFYHGRQAHADALRLIRQADFGFLIREKLRYSRAGFSTKFAECMSLGVPVLCNRVGGADTLLEGNMGQLLITDGSQATVRKALLELLNLSDRGKMNLKAEALRLAKGKFQAETYLCEMERLCKKLEQ